jgi:hypothetical protein
LKHGADAIVVLDESVVRPLGTDQIETHCRFFRRVFPGDNVIQSNILSPVLVNGGCRRRRIVHLHHVGSNDELLATVLSSIHLILSNAFLTGEAGSLRTAGSVPNDRAIIRCDCLSLLIDFHIDDV